MRLEQALSKEQMLGRVEYPIRFRSRTPKSMEMSAVTQARDKAKQADYL